VTTVVLTFALDGETPVLAAGRRYSEPGNLLTATGIPTPSSSVQTIEYERFGRRYSGGIRFNF